MQQFRILGYVNFGAPAGRVFNQMTFLNASASKSIWFNYATSYNQYVLVVYTNKDSFNVLKLFQPMDLWLWIGLAVSFVTTSLLIYGFSKILQSKVVDSLSIVTSFFTVFSILLEQSQFNDIGPRHPVRKTTFLFLITSWIWASLLISTCYKGDLFSYLTTETFPETPSNFEEMVNSSIMMTTSTKHYYRGQPYSTLKDYVLADLTYDGEGYHKFFAIFRHYTKLFKGEPFEVAKNLSRKLAVDTDWGLIKIPATFGTVSTSSDSNLLKMLISRYTDYFIQEKKLGPNPYMSRMPWYGTKNWYTSLFVRKLGSLFESGIYSRWLKNYQTGVTINQLLKSDRAQNMSSLNYYMILVMKGANVIGRDGQGSFKPVSIDNVQLCFIVWGGFILTAIVLIAMEMILHATYKTKVMPFVSLINTM
jgi:hypothetical protein